jgi:hypothetical protein
MEELISNDSQFELFSNSNGAMMLDRTLMSYPNEKNSFDVFLGEDGSYSYFEDSDKPKVDPEKVAGAITSGASAVSSIGSTIQAFKDPNKQPSRRKQLKEVCGRKPLTKKKQDSTGYTKCVQEYNAGKIGGTSQMPQEQQAPQASQTPEPTNNTKKIVIGLVVVGLVVTAIVGYKKGWFKKG